LTFIPYIILQKQGLMKRYFCAAFLLGLLSAAGAQTTIPAGEVSGKWNAGGSPYLVTGDIRIPHDSTLTIEPGVVVEFQGHFELKVMGRLLALGSITDTILFTVHDTTGFADPDTTLGGWKGIRIYDISQENDTTRLSYCRLQYGKASGNVWFLNAGGALCVIEFSKVVVSNCLFIHNSAGGPEEELPAGGAVHLAWSDIRLVNNTFVRNRAVEGGAIQMHDSDPLFRNNLISNNCSVNNGGGIAGAGGSNPSFSGDRIISNQAGSHGGGIMLWGPDKVSLDHMEITGNRANWGGGIGFVGCEAEILDSDISGNHAGWLGGGVAADGSILNIVHSKFRNDTSLTMAGAIHNWQGALNLRGCELAGNSGETGGALHVEDSHLMTDSCLFDSNEASVDGGGLDYRAGTLVFDTLYEVEISNTRFINNMAGNAAGGFSIQQLHTEYPLVNVSLDQCSVINNRARQVAGFRITRCIQGAILSNSLVSGNRADAWTGGGTFNAGTVGEVFNCVFYDNRAAIVYAASSGGFGVGNMSGADVINCTFVNNMADTGGGFYVHRGSAARLVNSIIRENYPDQIGVNAQFDSLPCLLAVHYSDIQYGPDSIKIIDTVSTLQYGMDNLDADPLFVNEASGNLHLQDESPLIGAGIDSIEIEGIWYFCPFTDMEGNQRPDPPGSRPDLGAYEHVNAWPAGTDDLQKSGSGTLHMKAYPNPFSHAVTLEFVLPERCRVDIRIFDLTGKEVTTLVCAMMDRGMQQVSWTPGKDRKGGYIVRVIAETASGNIYRWSGHMTGPV
jgi:hypothetical protein